MVEEERLCIIIACNLQEKCFSYGKGPIKTELNIGLRETTRLLGHDDGWNGPLGHFFSWLRGINEATIFNSQEIIFLKGNNHKKTQENTCNGNTINNKSKEEQELEDEKLILNLEQGMRENEHIEYINGINPVNDRVKALIYKLYEKHQITDPAKQVKVGILGLLAESTIYHLIYELKTRLNLSKMAVSTSLMASQSRSKMFFSADLMKKQFNVQIPHGLKKFKMWTVIFPSNTCQNIKNTLYNSPHMNFYTNAVDRLISSEMCCTKVMKRLANSENLKAIFAYMYREASSIKVKELTGGFSGSAVFRVQSWDEYHHEQSPTVLKVGKLRKIATEKDRYERVELVLGNRAPRMMDYLEVGDLGALKYSYASLAGEPTTFKALYEKGMPQETINFILNETFTSVLGKFYAQATLEVDQNLFDLYDFDGKGWSWWSGGSDTVECIKERIEKLVGQKGDAPVLKVSSKLGTIEVKNIALFMGKPLTMIKKDSRRIKNCVYMSFVHGDLNGGNILVDENRNVYLIDYEYTRIDHVLKDITKLENDILFEYTTIDNEEEFLDSLRIVQCLWSVNDLGKPLNDISSDLSTSKSKRAFKTIQFLRSLIPNFVQSDRSSFQMDVVLLRYALHSSTLTENCSDFQRKLALIAACGYAENIQRRACKNKNLYVSWLPSVKSLGPKGAMGITILPGRIDKSANMEEDIQLLSEQSVRRVLLLCANDEAFKITGHHVTTLMDAFHEAKIQVLHFAIPDQSIPLAEHVKEAIEFLYGGLSQNQKVIICSTAGLGRCGVFAACLLKSKFHFSSSKAIQTVLQARGSRGVETDSQKIFIQEFQ